MTIQRALLRKCLVTVGALVWPVSRMHPAVYGKYTPSSTALPTDIAHEQRRPGRINPVHKLTVLGDAALKLKRLVTDVATECSHIRVDRFVSVQVSVRLERPAADFTYVSSHCYAGTRVRVASVCFQHVGIGETHRTLVATVYRMTRILQRLESLLK